MKQFYAIHELFKVLVQFGQLLFYIFTLSATKDPVARKLRLRRRRDKQDESEKVLKGMRDVAKEKDQSDKAAQQEEEAKARK